MVMHLHCHDQALLLRVGASELSQFGIACRRKLSIHLRNPDRVCIRSLTHTKKSPKKPARFTSSEQRNQDDDGNRNTKEQ